ncbi:hypothetical protein R3P38DRAFT_2789142 [Favolaschia claudopus]|uniref:Uncharacterized protein n=1 Tax=Favolaschia claudopus TaxID=2862362 RepID=A0AAW0AKN4_9AGAR
MHIVTGCARLLRFIKVKQHFKTLTWIDYGGWLGHLRINLYNEYQLELVESGVILLARLRSFDMELGVGFGLEVELDLEQAFHRMPLFDPIPKLCRYDARPKLCLPGSGHRCISTRGPKLYHFCLRRRNLASLSQDLCVLPIQRRNYASFVSGKPTPA